MMSHYIRTSIKFSVVLSDFVKALANKYERTPEQIFFSFLISIGIHPLTGKV